MIKFEKLAGHQLLQASRWGGQSANAFVGGAQQGYDFAQKQSDAYQEAEMRKEKLKRTKMENGMYQELMDDARGTTTPEQKRIQELETKVAAQEKLNKKDNGRATSYEVNELTTAPDAITRDKVIQTTMARVRADSSKYAAAGIKPDSNMGIIDIRNHKDKKWLSEFLNSKGINPEELNYDVSSPEGNAKWEAVLAKSADMLPLVKVDNAYIDLGGLGAGIGANVQASPAQKEAMEKNMEYTKEVYDELFASATTNDYDTMNDGTPMGEAGAKLVKEGGSLNTMQESATQEADNNRENRVSSVLEPEVTEKVSTTPSGSGQEVNNYNDYLNTIDQHETDGTKDRYTQKNPHSSAYGRGQVINKTNATIAKRLGLTPEQARSRKGQGMVLRELYNDFTNTLDKNNLPKTKTGYYALHQMGETVGKKYLKGNLDSSVIKAMRHQFGKKTNAKLSDQEIVDKWENNFTKHGNNKVATAIDNERTKQGGDKPLSDMRLRKMYALLGKTYPKDPNESTAKMKNFDFLSPIVGKEKAMEAAFGIGKQGRAGAKTTLEKLEDKYREAVTSGDKESANMYKQAMSGEAGKYLHSKSQAGIEGYRDTVSSLGENANLTQEESEKLSSAKQQLYIHDNPATIRTGNSKSDITEEAATLAKPARVKSVNGVALDNNEVKLLADQERTNEIFYPSGAMKGDRDIVDDMTGRQATINSLTSLLNDIRDPKKNISNYDRGIIANVRNSVGQIVDPEIIGALDKTFGSNWKDKIEASVEKESRAGYIQAQFIRAMSGTAASDKERDFLIDVMQSGKWGDEKYLEQALETFTNMIKEENQTKLKQADKMPHSAYEATQYTAMTPKDTGVKDSKQISRTINGETRYWNGTSWVK